MNVLVNKGDLACDIPPCMGYPADEPIPGNVYWPEEGVHFDGITGNVYMNTLGDRGASYHAVNLNVHTMEFEKKGQSWSEALGEWPGLMEADVIWPSWLRPT